MSYMDDVGSIERAREQVVRRKIACPYRGAELVADHLDQGHVPGTLNQIPGVEETAPEAQPRGLTLFPEEVLKQTVAPTPGCCYTERVSGSDPTTPEEWQEAVNIAYACLALESAREYGFVTGGPSVDVERCGEVLSLARRMGIHPGPYAIEQFIGMLVKHGEVNWPLPEMP